MIDPTKLTPVLEEHVQAEALSEAAGDNRYHNHKDMGSHQTFAMIFSPSIVQLLFLLWTKASHEIYVAIVSEEA